MKILSIAGLLFCLAGCFSDAGKGDDVQADTPSSIDTLTLDEGSGEDATDTSQDTWPHEFEPVVFGVLSDIHLDGPFEDSIAQKVVGLIAKAAAAEPAPELILITGDLTDQMEEPVDTGEGSIIDALQKVIASSPVPVEPVLGNHDYYKTGGALFEWTPDPEKRTKVFEDAIGLPPWGYSVHGGMKFVHINSLLGPEAEKSLGLNGGMGAEQSTWLDDTLSDGVPAVLFLHHPPSIVLEEPGVATLEELITAHSANVLAVFVGHIHVYGRAEISGVPVFLTTAGYPGKDYHHVRVDPTVMTVEILNEEDIDYGETEVVPCEPERDPGLDDPAGLAGATLILQVPDGHIEPMGLGTYLRELVSELPMAVRLGDPGGDIPGFIAMAKRVGDGADGAPPHLAPVPDGLCEAITLTMDGPCFQTSPATLRIDVGKITGFPLPPGWYLRAELADMSLSGVLLDGPLVEQGVLNGTIDFNLGAEDLERIIAIEYCKGTMKNCQPGEGDLPECPDEPDADFFDEIPAHCDVELFGVGMRTLFDIFASVPGLAVSLDANFTVFPAEESADPLPGTVAPDLFDACLSD